MSQRERDRLVVVRQAAEGLLTTAEAARRVGIGSRQMRRQLRKYEVEGDRAVIHGLRGRPSNHRLPGEIRSKALEKACQPLYRDFAPTLMAEHLARDPEIGPVDSSTLRLWMIAAGRWQPEPLRRRHRRRRNRRAALGELLLMDTSEHAWLEARSSARIVLIALIDDATSRLFCRFFPKDTGPANRRLLIDYLEQHGRMGAVYADQASHFQVTSHREKRRMAEEPIPLTIIQQALKALDIELIRALSPQAKGRVERLFGTLQDRLIKEMRVQGIASLEEANRFLDEEFILFWNERFTVAPREALDAHRELPDDVDLLKLFAATEERVIGNDFSFRYRNHFYQIEAHQADGTMPGSRITIEDRLDGTLRFRWRERYLLPTPLFEPPARPKPHKRIRYRPTTATSPDPAQHPWRRHPIVVGRNWFTPPAPRATLSIPASAGNSST